MCQDCDCHNNDSGFIFGIVIGAVIGAAVAIYIYKNNKTDIIENLKEKLEGYFKPVKKIIKSEKIPVILPKKIIKETAVAKTVAPRPHKFVKPKN
jgi:gas vesicle protein